MLARARPGFLLNSRFEREAALGVLHRFASQPGRRSAGVAMFQVRLVVVTCFDGHLPTLPDPYEAPQWSTNK